MSHAIKPIPAIVEHCKMTNTSPEYYTPVIAQAYHEDKGWQTYPFKKRVSVSWIRKMRREGYTAVGLDLGNCRIADFRIAELLRVAPQPMKVPASAGTR